jgi:hypothetical protein
MVPMIEEIIGGVPLLGTDDRDHCKIIGIRGQKPTIDPRAQEEIMNLLQGE